jgi:hypothetical protein
MTVYIVRSTVLTSTDLGASNASAVVTRPEAGSDVAFFILIR